MSPSNSRRHPVRFWFATLLMVPLLLAGCQRQPANQATSDQAKQAHQALATSPQSAAGVTRYETAD